MKRYLTLAVCFVLMAMLTSCIVFREMRALGYNMGDMIAAL